MCFRRFARQVVVLWRLWAQEVCEDHLDSLQQCCQAFRGCNGRASSGADAVAGWLPCAPEQCIRRRPTRERQELSPSTLFVPYNCKVLLLSLTLLRALRPRRTHSQHLDPQPLYLAWPLGALCEAKLPTFPEWQQRRRLHAASRLQNFIPATPTSLTTTTAAIMSTSTSWKKVSLLALGCVDGNSKDHHNFPWGHN